MSKRTVVSDYIENKLNNIKKDSFLEEISSKNLSFKDQQELISGEIDSIYQYIKIIKENKKCYKNINGRKTLCKPVKEYISSLRKIVNKYLEYSKCLKLLERYQTRQDLIDKRIEFEINEIELNDNQVKLLSHLTRDSISEICFEDLGDIAKHLINGYENYNYRLEWILKELGSRFKHSDYSEDDYIILSSVKGVINKKIDSLEKDDNRRIKLREYKKYIKSIIDLIREKEDRKYDYRYEIVEFLLDDDYCFNRLLEEMPDIVNLKDREDTPLSHNVLEKYLDAYFLELQGKSKGKIKDELLKKYKQIIHHPFYLNDNPKDIEELLNHFIDTVKNGRFRREKYLEVLENLKKVNDVCDGVSYQFKIGIDEIIDETNYLLKKDDNKFRKNLCDEDTVVLCNRNEKYHNYAYSINKNELGNSILKVHLTDMREFIKSGSMLDLFLKENISKGNCEWLDESLLNKFSLNLNEKRPVFTFELELTPRGKINEFKCYKSNIVVNDIYTYEEVNSEIKNNNLRFLPYLEVNYFLNKGVDKNNYGLSIVNCFNKKVLDIVGKYFDKNKFPYIYKEQKEQDDNRYIKNMTSLNFLFSKISREDFKKFYQIINDDINYSKYTIKPTIHSSLKSNYYTDLFIPLYSYIGLFLQEMLNQFYLDSSENEIMKIKKAIWQKERDLIVERANGLRAIKRNNEHQNKIKKLQRKSL